MDAVPLPLHRLTLAPSPARRTFAAPVLLPALVILIGALLRLALLGVDVRLHPDEALFAAQARQISAWGDVLLRRADLDKPPLAIYSVAASFALLAPSEFAARLPNVFASILTLAALYRLALALGGDRFTGLLAALLLALSPYDLAFAATAFTDVQATLWAVMAALLAARGRWALAGAASALMVATKLNAALALPLIVALGLAQTSREDEPPRAALQRLGRFAGPLLIGLALLALWDAARAPQSFWALNAARNNPGRLIRSDELLPRLDAWAGWLHHLTGARALNAALLTGAAAGIAIGGRARTRAAAADRAIAAWAVAFLAAHWLIAVNTYDRYLHTLVPFLLLLGARGAVRAVRAGRLNPAASLGLLALAVVAMSPGVIGALRGQAPLGGDRGRHTGIDALADYLNRQRAGAVIYEHDLGWELAFYLGEQPAALVVYSPQPEALAAEMAGRVDTRYFAAPSAGHAAPWLDALARAGVQSALDYHDPAHGFVIYALIPR